LGGLTDIRLTYVPAIVDNFVDSVIKMGCGRGAWGKARRDEKMMWNSTVYIDNWQISD
jgi:hypothetical protein